MNNICILLNQMVSIPRYWNLYLNYDIVYGCSELIYCDCKTWLNVNRNTLKGVVDIFGVIEINYFLNKFKSKIGSATYSLIC